MFHPLESLAILYPNIAAEWDYELNKDTGYTPETIGIDTRKKFWWHCNNGYNHSYFATIQKRVNGLKCAVCHGKQVSPDTSLAALHPELVKEWCEDNDKTPFEVTSRSEYRALWKCANPNHPPFSRAVYYRTKYGMGVLVVGEKKNPYRLSAHGSTYQLQSYKKIKLKLHCCYLYFMSCIYALCLI